MSNEALSEVEERVLAVANTVDDIDDFLTHLTNPRIVLDEDDVYAAVNGIKELLKIRTTNLVMALREAESDEEQEELAKLVEQFFNALNKEEAND